MYPYPPEIVADQCASRFVESRASRRTFAGLCVLGAVMLSGATFVAMGASAVPPAVFDTVGKTAVLSVEAAGVQIYDCRADEAGHLAWKFREPLAILTADGQTVGRHFAGPSWQLIDGGEVVGKVVAQKPGATDKDIALLQLDVAGREGGGVMSRVTAVQRLDTHGGAFAGACQQAGALHVEPYSAQYVFLDN
nr:DUF3455 domain-containing protein [uncultured Pseudomonas sp.]